MGGTSVQGARAKIDKKILCKGNKKHREFSLILLGSDFLAGEHGNKLQTCLKSLEKSEIEKQKHMATKKPPSQNGKETFSGSSNMSPFI